MSSICHPPAESSIHESVLQGEWPQSGPAEFASQQMSLESLITLRTLIIPRPLASVGPATSSKEPTHLQFSLFQILPTFEILEDNFLETYLRVMELSMNA